MLAVYLGGLSLSCIVVVLVWLARSNDCDQHCRENAECGKHIAGAATLQKRGSRCCKSRLHGGGTHLRGQRHREKQGILGSGEGLIYPIHRVGSPGSRNP